MNKRMKKGWLGILVTSLIIGFLNACSGSKVNTDNEKEKVVVEVPKESKEPLKLNQQHAHQDLYIRLPPMAARKEENAQIVRYRGPASIGEKYREIPQSKIFDVLKNPFSTFSVDVDTGSYSNVRRFLENGQLPPKNAVRIEEMINYFDYGYDAKNLTPQEPFKWHFAAMPSPWSKDKVLLRLGLKAFQPTQAVNVDNNLVFLIDVSGSMRDESKLPLLKKSLKLLVNQLKASDRIALVVYAGASGVVLEPTEVKEKHKIARAIDGLSAAGSTNGASGIRLAYQLAKQHFIKGGNNRVFLATDGDFNVGVTNYQQLIEIIESQRASNIYLTTLGFGSGNYNEQLMEQLANKGNGNYAYIDSLKEAKRQLVDNLQSQLFAVANDVKVQVEFNPQHVRAYRLIGYQNRLLEEHEFKNDKVDAGEVGVGHSVTALYELELIHGSNRWLPQSRYQSDSISKPNALVDELALVKLRYKLPSTNSSLLLQRAIKTQSLRKSEPSLQLAVAVAGFGEWLRKSPFMDDDSLKSIVALAKESATVDSSGAGYELIELMELAQQIALTKS